MTLMLKQVLTISYIQIELKDLQAHKFPQNSGSGHVNNHQGTENMLMPEAILPFATAGNTVIVRVKNTENTKNNNQDACMLKVHFL